MSNRGYLWRILTTLRTDVWKNLLENEEDKVKLVGVHPEILNYIIGTLSLPKSRN